MSTGSKFVSCFLFFQFFFTIVSSFLEIFDGGTDIKSVKIYGDSCNHCTNVAESKFRILYTVNNYRQVTGMVTGENFAFFIYRHFVEIL